MTSLGDAGYDILLNKGLKTIKLNLLGSIQRIISTFFKFVSSKTGFFLGETRLICWPAGPTDPILSKNKKIILQNFGQLAIIYYFLLFEKRIRNKT